MSNISTAVTEPVVIGTPNYLAPLYVTSSGSVIPPASSGDIGVFSSVTYSGVELKNKGTIDGGTGTPPNVYGYYSGSGGDAVDFTATGGITNYANITGGAGAYARGGSGSGGIGVSMDAGTLTNSGSIAGGSGSNAYAFKAGSGGTGVSIDTGTLINTGSVAGGKGGNAADHAGIGGIGAIQIGGTLTNSGSITGGNGGAARLFAPGNAGVGVMLGSAGNL